MTPMADTRKRLPYLESSAHFAIRRTGHGAKRGKASGPASTTQEAKMDDLVKGRPQIFTPYAKFSEEPLRRIVPGVSRRWRDVILNCPVKVTKFGVTQESYSFTGYLD